MPSATVQSPAIVAGARDSSPYAIAQGGLSELIDAAAQTRRLEAMHAAMRVDLINLAIDYAVRSAEAFTSPTLSPTRRRDLARRAVVAELATALRLPERTMNRLVSEAWTLATVLPATLAAFRAGALDETHVRVIIDETAGLEDADVRARLDLELSSRAATTTAARLRRIARRLREQAQADTIAQRHERARAERRLELDPARDGMAWLHLHVAASDALLIRNRLDRVADDQAADAGDPATDARTPDQLRADIARDLLLHGVPPLGEAFHVAAATIRPTVHVTVPVLTLLGVDDAPGELDGYGPIDPDTARRLAAHAPSFTRLLTHPVSGTVLDVDRTTYRPPADLVRWLRVRDETCRFPGCNRRAARCDVDHSADWSADGRTAFDNLAHLCPQHPHLKHETSWSVRHLEHGRLEWRSPAGRRHVTEPSLRIAARPAPSQTRSIPPDRAGPAGPHPAPPNAPPF
ncbi:uncharacterized protein DUF222 [Agromyces ramosus]|uniref:Uncharacterized protein DUF222 n=1 Tax=Agromyces ramosus TaxID=33879 RepID=A0A4Q7MC76_9MICO|nr:HNH endonuclease signature motif containing protein [Agromyces ramosus]RZS65646.1 uncharacterized protein DUF222 [Agromyces ramosus]